MSTENHEQEDIPKTNTGAHPSIALKPTEVSSTSHPDIHLTTAVELFRTIRLFTQDDFLTFVFPNTIFGISAVLSERFTGDARQFQAYQTLLRLPLVIYFNWSNLLIFDLANQRLPESIEEDRINKPWRPLPAGRINQRQTRHLMIIAMPLVVLSSYVLSVWKETVLLFTLTWIYNDLGGGDDNWLIRNLVIASAFFLYNLGSLGVALGPTTDTDDTRDNLSSAAYGWTATISAIILTTMQVQDLKDQDGDRSHGRQTAPIVLGESTARRTIAIPILFWSLACATIWDVWILPIAFGSYVACRVIWRSGIDDDRRSWKLWCLWTALLYLLPLISTYRRLFECSIASIFLT